MGFITRLFTGKKADQSDELDPASAGSSDDYEEFISYLRGKERPFSKPGRTIKEEFKFWLADRNKKQAHAAGYNAARHFVAATQK